MITLTLLHPVQSTPVQTWSFENESVIRVGRSTDNHVILYSAVVSRHHVELRCADDQWELLSLGANGTYIEGKRVIRTPLCNGMTFRLARSGPNLQVHIVGAKPIGGSSKPDHAADLSPRSPAAVLRDHQASSSSAGPLTRLVMDDDVDLATAADNSERLFDLYSGRPLRVIQTIGSYQVLKRLKKGDLEVMYLAWQNGSTVALKTLNPDRHSDVAIVDRFCRQVERWKPLQHPGIPRVLDYFTIEEQPYCVTEMVYGTPLSQWVEQSGALPQPTAIAWIRELCEALQYLHQQEPPVAYGDLQPKHLIHRSVPRSGHTMLLEMPELLNDAHSSEMPTSLGTGYSAPEAAGDNPTIAADLYALGTILAFMLSGEDPGRFYGHREQGYRFYPEYVPGLSQDMVTIIRKLTQPNPLERYQSVAEVIADLQRIP